ncbi:MAG: outer membrane lipoprotein-sorting protein [Salinispira sp.]
MRIQEGFLLVCFTLCSVLYAQGLDTNEVIRQIDSLDSFGNEDFTAEYTIVSDKPEEERSVTKVRFFRRDREDKFLILIVDPLLRRGQGYLSVDDTAWSYDPESREFSIFNLSDNFEDTESRNSDFAETSLVDDYEADSYEEAMLGKYPVYVLDLKAVTDTVTFPRIRYWVRKDNYLPLKEENYSLSDRLVRTVYYPTYGRYGDYFIPTKILQVDNLSPGEQSEITVRGVSFNSIPDTVFTQSYLEQVNR